MPKQNVFSCLPRWAWGGMGGKPGPVAVDAHRKALPTLGHDDRAELGEPREHPVLFPHQGAAAKGKVEGYPVFNPQANRGAALGIEIAPVEDRQGGGCQQNTYQFLCYRQPGHFQ